MGLQIERKFLVTSPAWRTAAFFRETIRQGVLARAGHVSIRVRITDDVGLLTIECRPPGAAQDAFEFSIPKLDAAALLSRCAEEVIEKERHHVPIGDATWTVDEFKGRLAGLILAECACETENAPLALPEWIGQEVTHDPDYWSATF